MTDSFRSGCAPARMAYGDRRLAAVPGGQSLPADFVQYYETLQKGMAEAVPF